MKKTMNKASRQMVLWENTTTMVSFNVYLRNIQIFTIIYRKAYIYMWKYKTM